MTNAYKVTRRFTDGILKGLTHTGTSSVAFPVGYECGHPIGGSPYVIEECVPVTVRKFADGLKKTNPKFNEKIFIAAASGEFDNDNREV